MFIAQKLTKKVKNDIICLFFEVKQMDELKNSINRGAPIATPVTLSSVDLITLCDDKEKAKEAIDNAFTKYMNYIKKIGVPSVDMEFFQTLGIMTNPKTLEKQLCFSKGGFIASIFMNLNVDNIFTSQISPLINLMDSNDELCDELSKKVVPRLKILQEIRTESELKKEFPALYKKFQERQQMIVMLKQLVRMMNQNNISSIQKMKTLQEVAPFLQLLHIENISQIDEYNPASDFPKFCQQYYDSLNSLLDHAQEIMLYLDTHRINIWNFSNMDRDKISLYIASRFLETAEALSLDQAQRYLYNIADYFREHPEKKQSNTPRIRIGKYKNKSMGIKSDGIILTPKKLYAEYKKMLMSHPELRIVDFSAIDFTGMTLGEVENYTQKMLFDLQANWELIPPSHIQDDFHVRGVKVKIVSEKERQKKIEQLSDLYIEKKEFYDSTAPLCRVVGKNTFSGYVGHIYVNGKVILDRFLENEKTGRVAEGHAIYVMDAMDFCRLSTLTKRELFHHPFCRRIIHTGDWKKKVQDMIQQTDVKEMQKKM